jgi:hypothetical protein
LCLFLAIKKISFVSTSDLSAPSNLFKMESNEERVEKQRKFPKAVPFVLVNVFFERFCSGGILGELRKFCEINTSLTLIHINQQQFLRFFSTKSSGSTQTLRLQSSTQMSFFFISSQSSVQLSLTHGLDCSKQFQG